MNFNFTSLELALEQDVAGSSRLQPWMVPTPVKILPNLQEREQFTRFEHLQRFSFFIGVTSGAILGTGLILEITVRVVNSIWRRRKASGPEGHTYTALAAHTPIDDAPAYKPAASMHVLETGGHYSITDVYFTMYLAFYQIFCGVIVFVSLRHGYVDSEFGMNFELYILWILEALIVHIISAFACIWTRIKRPGAADIKGPLPSMCISLAPFVSERFNLLRDWVTLGIYFNCGHLIGNVCGTIVFLSIVWVVVVNFNEPKLVLSMRLNYWPVAKQAMAVEEQGHQFNSKTAIAFRTLFEALDSYEKDDDRTWRGRIALFRLGIICEMDIATQQHKVVNTLYGEIPQAIASVMYVFFSQYSTFVAICLVINFAKVIMLLFVRPYVLCLMADAYLGWQHVKSNDLEGLLSSRKRYRNFCRWEKRVLNALNLVKDMKEGAVEVSAAIRCISIMLLEPDDDESAALVVMYTTFLRALYLELAQDSEGVSLVRQAITETLLELVPGIEERDVTAAAPSPGNLGYIPTGDSMKEVRKMIDEMQNQGQHDVVKLLEAHKGNRFAVLPQKSKGGRHEDLMICFTDCEADDVMAIAQLWQWKMEKKKMATEPIVIFSADFSSKDRGTVFEKKMLLTQLVLGVRRFFVLTPVETFSKNERKNDQNERHPSADYWESRRANELVEISAKIRQFRGHRIHFYIMASGKGCIDSVLQRLRKDYIWPSKQKWKVSIYSEFNIGGMTKEDINAIQEIGAKSGTPLLDIAKFPLFGGKDCHPWTSCFTTFAPKRFPSELNMSAHPFIPAVLKLLNDEHNFGLVAPEKLYRTKQLSRRERLRFDALKHHYHEETVGKYCKLILEDFALYSKVEEFKKSTVTAFAFDCCDSPLAAQLVFSLEVLLNQFPQYLKNSDVVGAWVVSHSKGFTSVDPNVKSSVVPNAQRCMAIRPILAEPKNESRLNEMRQSLQVYFMKHLVNLAPDA